MFWAVYAHGRSVFLLPSPSNSKGIAQEIRHTHEVSAVCVYRHSACSSDAILPLLAIGDVRGKVKVVRDGGILVEEQLLSDRVMDLKFSTDGQTLMAVGDGRGSYCSALAFPSPIDTGMAAGEWRRLDGMAGPTKRCATVAYGTNGWWAVGSDDFTVSLFHSINTGVRKTIANPILKKTLRDHGRFVTVVAFQPNATSDGRVGKLATGGADGRVFIYSHQQDEEWKKEEALSLDSMITGLEWLANDRLMVSVAAGSLQIWNLAKQPTLQGKIQFNQQILATSCASSLITVGLLGGTLIGVDSTNLATLHAHQGHVKGITTMIFNQADGHQNHLCSGDLDGRIIDWEQSSTAPSKVAASMTNEGQVAFITPSGWFGLITNSTLDVFHRQRHTENPCSLEANRVLASMEIFTGRLILVTDLAIWMISSGDKSTIKSSSFGENQKISAGAIAIASKNDSSSLTNENKSSITIYVAIDKSIRMISYDNDGFAVNSEWTLNIETMGRITNMTASDKWLAIADDNRRLHLHQRSDGASVPTVTPTKWCHHTAAITCLGWSPNGKFLVSGGLDNALLFWSPEESRVRPMAEIRNAHAAPLTMLIFDPKDERTVWSAGADAAIRKWTMLTKSS